MPWCPKCKNEYVEGILVCADCGCELVESLEQASRKPLMFGPQEEMEELMVFLTSNQITSAELAFSKEEGLYEISVSQQEEKRAQRCMTVFFSQRRQAEPEITAEQEEGLAQEAATKEELVPEDLPNAVRMGRMMRSTGSGVYEEAAKKAEEFKSGAYMLVIAGVIGLAVLGALMSGVLPIRLDFQSQMMICLVMGALFIIFIVMGVLSYRSYQELAGKAVKESSLKDELKKFCQENLRAEKIDALLQLDESEQIEMRYFKRTALMKKIISENFLNLEEGYLDNFVDEIYQQMFEEE